MPCLEFQPLESPAKNRTSITLKMPRLDRSSPEKRLNSHAKQKIDNIIQREHNHILSRFPCNRQFNFSQQINKDNDSPALEKEVKRRNNLAFFEHFDKYMADIELASNIKVPEVQKTMLKEYVRTHEIEFMTQEQRNRARKQYNNIKSSLIEDWEKNNNAKWPYTKNEPEYYNGKLISNRSVRYQLHHMILLSYGGPNVWWNIHPAMPIKHQEIIHGEKSVSKKIFA